MANDILAVVKYVSLAAAGLMVAGIAMVMVLARGTGEDITGVMAPALLLTTLSVATAVVAAVLQRVRDRRKPEAGDDPIG